MPNNKPSGPALTRFLLILSLIAGLAACGSAPKEPPPAPEPVQKAPEPEPEPQPAPPPPPPAEAPAPSVRMQDELPDRYVVKKGDTLWDIAARFLKDPWMWPKIWHVNPEIRNPHLIYPGDVIRLHWVDGKPYLTLEGVGGVAPPKGIKTVKLKPQVRVEPLDKAIDVIPRSLLEPFLYSPRVVSKEELEKAPYIVSSLGGHLISATGATVYARNVTSKTIPIYDVVKPGIVYKDPDTGEILGHEVVTVAQGRVTRLGDPTTLVLSNARGEVLDGYYLLPSEEKELQFNFFPYPPDRVVRGRIIAVFNGVSQIGQYNVVVLNIGERNGLKPGHVLAVNQQGAVVRDPYARHHEKVQLPAERAGILMVFRTYDKVSYGLIMKAERALHVGDYVLNP